LDSQINAAQDSYIDRLVKLLPAEGIAALTASKGIIRQGGDSFWWLWGTILVVGIFVVLWAARVRNIRSPLQLTFILLAYVIWAANVLWEMLQPNYETFANTPDFAPALVAILFTLFIPFAFPNPVPASPK